jgi:hypothetical protein
MCDGLVAAHTQSGTSVVSHISHQRTDAATTDNRQPTTDTFDLTPTTPNNHHHLRDANLDDEQW